MSRIFTIFNKKNRKYVYFFIIMGIVMVWFGFKAITILLSIAIINLVVTWIIGFPLYNEYIRRIFGVCLLHHFKYMLDTARAFEEEPTKFYTEATDKFREGIYRRNDGKLVSHICKECPNRCTVHGMIERINKVARDD